MSGLLVTNPSCCITCCRPIVWDLVEEVIVVDDSEITEAMKLYYGILKVAVEPSGAIGLAAVLSKSFHSNPAWTSCRDIGIILSGGNLDLGALWNSFRVRKLKSGSGSLCHSISSTLLCNNSNMPMSTSAAIPRILWIVITHVLGDCFRDSRYPRSPSSFFRENGKPNFLLDSRVKQLIAKSSGIEWSTQTEANAHSCNQNKITVEKEILFGYENKTQS